MAFWLFMLAFYTPSIIENAQDPLEGWLPSDIDIRSLDCTPITIEGARQLAPEQIAAPMPRGEYLTRNALACRERLMAPGVRKSQDDVVLSNLRGTADEMAALVGGLAAEHQEKVWLVETFYPDIAVGQKVAFAVKNALLDRNLKVSDRAPTLAAGDIEVISQMAPPAAYPLACQRYFESGGLKSGDALLAIVSRDSRETILHAGTCLDGKWRWRR